MRLAFHLNIWNTIILSTCNYTLPYDPFVTILDLLFMTGDDALAYISNTAR